MNQSECYEQYYKWCVAARVKVMEEMDRLLIEDAFKAVERGWPFEDLAIGEFPDGYTAICEAMEPGSDANILGPLRRVETSMSDRNFRAWLSTKEHE